MHRVPPVSGTTTTIWMTVAMSLKLVMYNMGWPVEEMVTYYQECMNRKQEYSRPSLVRILLIRTLANLNTIHNNHNNYDIHAFIMIFISAFRGFYIDQYTLQ